MWCGFLANTKTCFGKIIDTAHFILSTKVTKNNISLDFLMSEKFQPDGPIKLSIT